MSSSDELCYEKPNNEKATNKWRLSQSNVSVTKTDTEILTYLKEQINCGLDLRPTQKNPSYARGWRAVNK